MPTVLIIEDDTHVRDLVMRYLQHEGMHVVPAADGASGLAAVAQHRPHLVLLDIHLPDLDGWTILRRLREEGEELAVIVLTARSDEPDRVLGFDLGADDYIVKPFSPRELVGRVKAVLRRTAGERPREVLLEFPGLRIDEASHAVWRQDETVALTRKEFDLLALLARNAGRVLTRSILYDSVWGDEGQGDDHTLDVHINRLRRKLSGRDGLSYVETLKGVGFKFEVHHEPSSG